MLIFEKIMLRGEELFKYRNHLEKALPQKSGQKEYIPDGSWLQDKCIESFHQERERALAEPRVMRKCDLVQGEWNPKKKLVELWKDMKNFWEVMGFTDKQRKWLFVEEALFLMETTVLQVWYKGLPLSIQEAYSILLEDTVSLEYYQVYSHLRRIGYVVIRHQGRSNFTKYEQQLGLDKVLGSKRKRKDKGKTYSKDVTESNVSMDMKKSDQLEDGASNVDFPDTRQVDQTESDVGDEIMDIEEAQSVGDRVSSASSSRQTGGEVSGIETAVVTTVDFRHTGCNRNVPADDVSQESTVSSPLPERVVSKWNFNEILFPNFGSDNDSVVVKRPDVKFTPGGLQVVSDEYSFRKSDYINTKRVKRSHREQDRALTFSHPDIMTGSALRSCKNWTEYKMLMKSLVQRDRTQDFPHLYSAELQPLVDPQFASSTAEVLNQLQLIEEYPLNAASLKKPEVLPDLDVYSPSTSFKKTNPGRPDFRILIARSSDPPPDLKVIADISSYLNDDITLNCAVVSCGEVVFFSVADFSLPLDISLG